MELNAKRFSRAAGLMLGMDVGYNIGSFSLSSPQTTQWRIEGKEGEKADKPDIMKWVWISTVKCLVYTGVPSLLGGTIWPLIGGLIVIGDFHGSYLYAIRCGQRSKTPAGKRLQDAGLSVAGSFGARPR